MILRKNVLIIYVIKVKKTLYPRKTDEPFSPHSAHKCGREIARNELTFYPGTGRSYSEVARKKTLTTNRK